MALSTHLERRYFFSHLRERAISEQELGSQANTLIVAGSETTSTVLTGLICFLLQNKPALDHLDKEVQSTLKSLDEITGEATNSLPYLMGCIDEGLRLLPSIAFGPP